MATAKKHYDDEDVKAILEMDVDNIEENEDELPESDFVEKEDVQ